MSQSSDPNSKPLSVSEAHGWLGQLLSMVAISSVLVLGYAFYSESALFRAAGLQLLLTTAVIWSTRRTARLPTRTAGEKPEPVIEAWSLHFIFTAAPVVVVLFGTLLSLLIGRVEVARPLSPQQIAASAIVAVLAASLWTALRQMSRGIVAERVTGMPAVEISLHEARLVWFLVAVAQLVSTFFPAAPQWLAAALQFYLAAVLGEILLRLMVAWFQLERVADSSAEDWPDPLDSLIREVLLSSINPLDSVFQIAERRFGLSLRSSWSIRFFRRATPPAIVATLIMLWLSTAVAVVQPDQLALYESMGHIAPTPLTPGMHVIKPWPLGRVRRVSVGEVRTMQIGFSQPVDEAAVVSGQPRSLLWTDTHTDEFALVLGAQSELISVNLQIYFQVGRSTEQLADYLYRYRQPEAALEALAYQVLREETQSATLDAILSEDRAAFAQRIRQKVQQKAEQQSLGIEVVDVSLLSLHPPVQIASAYLGVSNAERDAERLLTEAQGSAAVKLLASEKEAAGSIAAAQTDSARRLGLAGQESSHFSEASRAYQAAAETYRLRLWFEALESALRDKRVYVIDSELDDVLMTDSQAPTELAPILSKSSKPSSTSSDKTP